MWTSVLLALGLVLATSVFHFTVLSWLSGGMARIVMRRSVRLMVIVLALLLAHLVEMGIYGAAYGAGVQVLGIGGFAGRGVSTAMDYLYFSIVTFTSLGLGDVFPLGHLRFLAGVETLNGLLLIAWSGSFIYIAMGRLWAWTPCAEPDCGPTTSER